MLHLDSDPDSKFYDFSSIGSPKIQIVPNLVPFSTNFKNFHLNPNQHPHSGPKSKFQDSNSIGSPKIQIVPNLVPFSTHKY